MQKIILGLSLSLVMFVGACGGSTGVPEQCFSSNKADGTPHCLPIYPVNCCAGLSLQKDKTNCPVRAGLVGGMPMRCM